MGKPVFVLSHRNSTACSVTSVPPRCDEIAKITVTDLRLPRALVGMILGANLAVAGALLQTITRNPLASPTLLSVNSGASLAMVTASAFSPLILSGYSIALVASIGGGISWFVVMLISNGWKDNSGDRSRVILAGIAVSLLCAALTKLVLIIAEDHAFGIMSWLAGGIAHARLEWIIDVISVLYFDRTFLSILWLVV